MPPPSSGAMETAMIVVNEVWVSKKYTTRKVTVTLVSEDRVYYVAPPLAPGCCDFHTSLAMEQFLEVFRKEVVEHA
jgi:hypothetical protein